jgi:hypothetical protein
MLLDKQFANTSFASIIAPEFRAQQTSSWLFTLTQLSAWVNDSADRISHP